MNEETKTEIVTLTDGNKVTIRWTQSAINKIFDKKPISKGEEHEQPTTNKPTTKTTDGTGKTTGTSDAGANGKP